MAQSPLQSPMRLNRFLARCGAASRRGAEELIRQGRVRVQGRVVRELTTEVLPERDRVELDGRRLQLPAVHTSWALHKPAGYDVTRRDPHARRTIFELLGKDAPRGLHAIGRLDRPTTGLLLLTTDGELAHRIAHPGFGMEKEYLALGDEAPTQAQIRALVEGVGLHDGPARAVKAEPLGADAPVAGDRSDHGGRGIRIVMHLGRKRIIRRLMKAVGYEITALHRVRVGPIRLGTLKSGRWRELTPGELNKVYEAVGLASV